MYIARGSPRKRTPISNLWCIPANMAQNATGSMQGRCDARLDRPADRGGARGRAARHIVPRLRVTSDVFVSPGSFATPPVTCFSSSCVISISTFDTHLLARGSGFDCGGHHTCSIRSKRTRSVYAQSAPAACDGHHKIFDFRRTDGTIRERQDKRERLRGGLQDGPAPCKTTRYVEHY